MIPPAERWRGWPSLQLGAEVESLFLGANARRVFGL